MRRLMIAAACLVGLMGPHAAVAASPKLDVLSSAADRVTASNALIEIAAAAPVRVMVNGVDQTEHFSRDPATGRLRGLVDGLKLGTNEVSAQGADGRTALKLTNYPLAGPVFSGPHQRPFVCETEAFKLPDGSPLGQAQGPDCFAPTKVQYLYMPAGEVLLKPLDLAAPRPANIARVKTSTGVETDYIVRLETGVINRAIYQIAVLASPDWTAQMAKGPPAWNGALVYSFGGGCGVAYRQGRATGGVVNGGEMINDPLAMGYAVASASLNVLGQNCNDVTSAETAMMVKEHFIESFGPPRFTIGLGGSGGSMQQNLITHNYPGILDGIIPQRSFPDTATMLVSAADCPLIHNYFEKAGGSWTEAQKAAVHGFPTSAHCSRAWFNYLPRWISPLAGGCDATAFITRDEAGAVAGTKSSGMSAQLYDPVKSPNGVRCGYFDNAVNIFGRNPDGSARSFYDNVGVQYGLKAFNDGVISFEQFVDLNQKVGGYNSDAGFIPARSKGDPQAIRNAYATGRINTGEGMDRVPLIDMRTYTDPMSPPDVHMAYTTEMARQRWLAAGAGGNMAFIRITPTAGVMQEFQNPQSNTRVTMRSMLSAMDEWLEAIRRDDRPGSVAERIARNKPAALVDACFDPSMKAIPTSHQAGDECSRLYPDDADARIVAGDSIKRLVLKCTLQPVSQKLYGMSLTDAQLKMLRDAFPQGVCDYSRPSQYFAPFAGPWLSYSTDGRFQTSQAAKR